MSLKISFECEYKNVIFLVYNLYFASQMYGQYLTQKTRGAINQDRGSTWLFQWFLETNDCNDS